MNSASLAIVIVYVWYALDIRRSADFSDGCFMREFGRYPVMWHWVALATRFWIRAIKMGSQKLVCKTLRADIELMLTGCKKCWSYYLLQSLQS